jgi:hypothetical protein
VETAQSCLDGDPAIVVTLLLGMGVPVRGSCSADVLASLCSH